MSYIQYGTMYLDIWQITSKNKNVSIRIVKTLNDNKSNAYMLDMPTRAGISSNMGLNYYCKMS
ncbi:hypothetical protein [Pelagibaculum spongiae]|uniref:hypothetical protein n=1 Tax=Pelagibaculum spongiae TaxID=2080658 RepID=UPI00105795CF|nr:hypothetical protein [Pelagibaculum spongiae]